MAEHTPTPWTVAHRKGQAVIRGPSTECLAALPYAPCEGYGLMDVFEVGANAAFIVKAVNSLGPSLDAIEELCRKRGLSPTADSIGLLIAEWVNGEQHS